MKRIIIENGTPAIISALKSLNASFSYAEKSKHHFSDDKRLKGLAARQKNAEEANKPLRETAEQLAAEGLTISQIARRMNDMGITTRYGKMFSACTIKRLFK